MISIFLSLLSLRLEELSIVDSGMLKCPKMNVLLSISFLKSSKIFLIYLGTPMLDAYMFIIFMSSWWIIPLNIIKWLYVFLFMAFVLKSFLFNINITTPAFFFAIRLLGNFFSNPSLSICIALLFWLGSPVGSICVGHVFLSINLPVSFDWSI